MTVTVNSSVSELSGLVTVSSTVSPGLYVSSRAYSSAYEVMLFPSIAVIISSFFILLFFSGLSSATLLTTMPPFISYSFASVDGSSVQTIPSLTLPST